MSVAVPCCGHWEFNSPGVTADVFVLSWGRGRSIRAHTRHGWVQKFWQRELIGRRRVLPRDGLEISRGSTASTDTATWTLISCSNC